VLPIMATIDRPKAPTDALTLAIHGAAKWSLGSNARQHPVIMQLCKEQIDLQPPEIASELRKIVAGE
jgi:hypothetical protein